MKNMSNVDIYAICHEMREVLKGARVDKAFQPAKDTVLIRFHVARKGRVDAVFQAGIRTHLTQYPLPNPKIPPNFPMLLRKYIKGATVEDIKQHNFDRIIEIEVKKEHRFTLIVELFAKGNIILLNEEGRIILPLKRKLWSDRKISSKEEYKYPPKRGINPLELKKDELKELFDNSSTDIIRTLARSGLGGVYAEEIIMRSGVQKELQASEIPDEDLNSIYRAIEELFEPLKTSRFHPQIVKGEKEDVVPIDLKIYENNEKEVFETYNLAADEFYSSKVREDIKSEYEGIWGSEVKKFEKRLKIQEDTLAKFHRTITESKKKGDLIYSNYGKIQNILDIIMDARKKYSWNEIASTLKQAKKQGMEEAQIIESLDKLGNLNLKIDNTPIMIDATSPIPENAEVYYEKAKKAERKKAEESLIQAHLKLENKVKERTRELQEANEELKIEIIRRKELEEALQESEKKLKEIIHFSPVPQFVIDNEHNVIYWNRALEIQSNIPAGEIVGTKNQWQAFYDYERPSMCDLLVDKRYKDIPRYFGNKYKRSRILEDAYEAIDFFPSLGNRGKWLHFTAAAIKNSKNEVIGAVETLVDITEQRKAEDEIRKSLEEKEVLLREIHHRVKNNLQIISSLINLQSNGIDDKKVYDAFKEIQNRVKSIALIHEKLYQSKDISKINFADYIPKLASDLCRSYDISPLIDLEVDVDNVLLDINKALPCGLIINELITNSIKHAFKNVKTHEFHYKTSANELNTVKKGKISISFRYTEDEYEMIVSDNGTGYPEDLDIENTETLGLRLVNSLKGQLNGEVELKNMDGAFFRLTFKNE